MADWVTTTGGDEFDDDDEPGCVYGPTMHRIAAEADGFCPFCGEEG